MSAADEHYRKLERMYASAPLNRFFRPELHVREGTRPVSEGILRAHGRVVHRSRSLILAEAELTNDAGETVARGSGSFLPSKMPLSADIGYV